MLVMNTGLQSSGALGDAGGSARNALMSMHSMLVIKPLISFHYSLKHYLFLGLFSGHKLLLLPPPKPFWEELNVDSDNERMEVRYMTHFIFCFKSISCLYSTPF